MLDLSEILGIATFLMVLAIILGAYWVVIVRSEGEELGKLRARLRVGRHAVPVLLDLLKEAKPFSAIRGFNVLLTRMTFLASPLRSLITASGVQTTVGTILLASGTLFVVALWLTVTFTGIFSLGFLLAVLAGAIPFAVLRYARERRMLKFEQQFPESVDLIARSLRAGHAFATGLKLAGEESPDPLGAEFRLLADRHNYGQPLPQALREFADRLMIIDARFFVTAVLTQREAGGNLAEVLDHLSSVIRDRFKVKREVRTKSAHGRMTGYVIAGLPPFLFLYMWISSPDRVQLLVQDPLGIRMVIGALSLQVIGTLIIRKIVDIRY